MNINAKTIQIFLPSGDPRGIRTAEITTRIVRVIEVPRSLVGDLLTMSEAQQVGLYFLFGEKEGGDIQQVYIGQSGNVGGRVSLHNQGKDFWNRALVCVSLTNNLTQTHALYLEWLCLKAAQEAGRYALENGNAGARPHTPAPLEADCHEIYDTVRTLAATLGYPIFEPLVTVIQKGQDEVFFCTGAGTEGRGLYTEEGFVVLAGSIGRLSNVPSFAGTPGERFRQRLLDEGAMVAKGENVVFEKDHLFNSPSMAAMALLGRTSNGWTQWRTKSGRTLDEVKRQGTRVVQD